MLLLSLSIPSFSNLLFIPFLAPKVEDFNYLFYKLSCILKTALECSVFISKVFFFLISLNPSCLKFQVIMIIEIFPYSYLVFKVCITTL